MLKTDLMQRLERLERDNRRLKGFGVAMLVVAAALGSIYAARHVPDTITGREFRVVDSTGETQVLISTNKLHGPMVALFDKGNIPRIGIGLYPGSESFSGPYISVGDPKGKAGALIRVSPDGEHAIAPSVPMLEEFEPYCLPHTALPWLAESGCDAFTLARIAGHSSITITQRYCHPQAEAIESAFAKVAGTQNVCTKAGYQPRLPEPSQTGKATVSAEESSK